MGDWALLWLAAIIGFLCLFRRIRGLLILGGSLMLAGALFGNALASNHGTGLGLKPPAVAPAEFHGDAPAAANRALGKRMAARRGWTGSQWNALDRLVQSESGWRNTAQNPTSSAYGIGQFLDKTWPAYGYRKTSNPRVQIAAMLKYIGLRYGTPEKAWTFKQRRNYY